MLSLRDSHTAVRVANSADRWTQYRKRRVNSLLRLQIGNFLFLCVILSCMAGVNDTEASAVLFNETCLWLFPTLFSLLYLTISVLYPSSVLCVYLDSLDTWGRMSYFLNSIRFYRLVVNICNAAGIYEVMYEGHKQTVQYGNMVIAIVISTDVSYFCPYVNMRPFLCIANSLLPYLIAMSIRCSLGDGSLSMDLIQFPRPMGTDILLHGSSQCDHPFVITQYCAETVCYRSGLSSGVRAALLPPVIFILPSTR